MLNKSINANAYRIFPPITYVLSFKFFVAKKGEKILPTEFAIVKYIEISRIEWVSFIIDIITMLHSFNDIDMKIS